MNRGLVTCLLGSALGGVAAAGAVVGAGWGWLPAVAAYSCVGSSLIIISTALTLPGRALQEREDAQPEATAASRKRARWADALARPHPQRT